MRVSDAFTELFAYTAYFKDRLAQEQPEYETVRNEILRLVQLCEDHISGLRLPPEDASLAKFAVFAWIDESILASPWQGRAKWSKEQLQKVYFNTTDAGEEFFQKLNALSPQQSGVREVYYLCLALGFTGRFHNQADMVLLDQLKTSNLAFITGSSMGVPALDREPLFPEAYPSEDQAAGASGRRFSWTMLGLACAPVLLFVLLYGIYTLVLGSVGDNFLQTVF